MGQEVKEASDLLLSLMSHSLGSFAVAARAVGVTVCHSSDLSVLGCTPPAPPLAEKPTGERFPSHSHGRGLCS